MPAFDSVHLQSTKDKRCAAFNSFGPSLTLDHVSPGYRQDAESMTLTRGSFTYSSGEEYHGDWKEGRTFHIPHIQLLCRWEL